MQKKFSKSDAPSIISDVEVFLDDNDFIVSKTDLKGYITYCNRIFVDMCAYTIKELIGSNHNLIRHPDMPKLAYKVAWDMIKNGEEFFGLVKNLRKDGGYYWVFTYIASDIDYTGKTIGYTSFRRKASRSAIEKITPIYKQLVQAEENGGIEASSAMLNLLLEESNITYTDFIINLQREIL